MDRFEFDDVYVRRLREHDPEVEEHFYKYFRELLTAKLRRRVPEDDVLDVIHETLARVIRDLDKLREAPKLGSFVNSYCNNVLLEGYRRRREEQLDERIEQLADKTNIELELQRKRDIERVRRILGRMKGADAQILHDVYLDEEDKDEICRKRRVGRAYLRVLLLRARERFRDEHSRKSSPRFNPETFLLESSLLP